MRGFYVAIHMGIDLLRGRGESDVAVGHACLASKPLWLSLL